MGFCNEKIPTDLVRKTLGLLLPLFKTKEQMEEVSMKVTWIDNSSKMLDSDRNDKVCANAFRNIRVKKRICSLI